MARYSTTYPRVVTLSVDFFDTYLNTALNGKSRSRKITILKLIYNLKEMMTVSVWISDLNQLRFLQFTSPFSS